MRKSSGDDFYVSRKWKDLRRSILRRDMYRCQHCKGTIEAEHVHHIFPREQYPEYQWEPWNLISLCFKCHNKMHNRYTGELSRLGRIQMNQKALEQGISIVKELTVLVIGLRGCGKSTYVLNKLDGDSLAYDMDAIASAFRLKKPHEEYYKPARRMANDFLPGFISKVHSYVKKVYVIRTAPTVKEFEMIGPDKLVICRTQYNYREMDDRKAAQERIDTIEEYAKKNNIEIEYT